MENGKSFRFGKSVLFAAVVFAFVQSSTFVSAEDTATIPVDKSKFHVFLLMGQSNMEGANSIDGEMDTETDPRILKLGTSGMGSGERSDH